MVIIGNEYALFIGRPKLNARVDAVRASGMRLVRR